MKNSNPFLNQQFLAHAFCKGNEQALAILYEEFHPVLSYYAYNILNNRSIAEEIACGAFIKSWKMNWKLDTYGATETAFEKLVRTELYHLLYNALKALSPGNQKVITMYFLEDKNTNEIARELNLHPSTVKTQKNRGLEALRKLLMNQENIVKGCNFSDT